MLLDRGGTTLAFSLGFPYLSTSTTANFGYNDVPSAKQKRCLVYPTALVFLLFAGLTRLLD